MNKLKLIRIFLITTTFFAIAAMPTSVSADLFFRTGTIVRTLSDSVSFGGCMVFLSAPISNGCPDNGWVSLDCQGKYFKAEDGKRAYASALVAFSLGKQVSIQVDNARKLNGICISRRVDILN